MTSPPPVESLPQAYMKAGRQELEHYLPRLALIEESLDLTPGSLVQCALEGIPVNDGPYQLSGWIHSGYTMSDSERETDKKLETLFTSPAWESLERKLNGDDEEGGK